MFDRSIIHNLEDLDQTKPKSKLLIEDDGLNDPLEKLEHQERFFNTINLFPKNMPIPHAFYTYGKKHNLFTLSNEENVPNYTIGDILTASNESWISNLNNTANNFTIWINNKLNPVLNEAEKIEQIIKDNLDIVPPPKAKPKILIAGATVLVYQKSLLPLFRNINQYSNAKGISTLAKDTQGIQNKSFAIDPIGIFSEVQYDEKEEKLSTKYNTKFGRAYITHAKNDSATPTTSEYTQARISYTTTIKTIKEIISECIKCIKKIPSLIANTFTSHIRSTTLSTEGSQYGNMSEQEINEMYRRRNSRRIWHVLIDILVDILTGVFRTILYVSKAIRLI